MISSTIDPLPTKELNARLTAVVIIGCHMLLSLAIQIENYFLHIYERSDGWSAAARFIAGLPFGQMEHLFVSLVIAFPALIIRSQPLLRYGYFLSLTALNLFLVVDQIAFPIFFDHVQLSFSEGRTASFASLWDSIVAEVTPAFYFNALIWAATTAVLYWSLVAARDYVKYQPKIQYWQSRFRAEYAGWLFVAYFLVNAVAGHRYENHNLENHALITLLRSIPNRQPVPVLPAAAPSMSLDDIYRPRFGFAAMDDDSVRQKLAPVYNLLRDRETAPNIIFIVLESVGSLQLAPDGVISEKYTPNLRQMFDHAVFFDAIYTPFPGTIRSHVPMMTGGRTITWGSVFDEFDQPYLGPVLVSELKGHGYKTALVSAGDFETENMRGFYDKFNYDYTFEPGTAAEDFVDKHKIHTWGVNEEIVEKLAMDWIDSIAGENKPFFLHFLTISTHHPYGVPEGYPGPLTGDDRWTRYYNSLHYNDHVLGKMIDDLRRRQLLDDTLIFITGDHGQAFGKRHPKNFTHKNYIYEENIKTFFMIVDFQRLQSPVVVDRPGSVGDLMPTILGLANIPIPADILGQNLFSPDYQNRIVYFHKNANPELWGLRDGQWKFIDSKIGTTPELYDLAADSSEQDNLAAQYPERIEIYEELCRQWYVRTNDDYTNRLRGYELVGGRGLSAADVTSPGPKVMSFGYMDDDNEFRELQKINPYEDMVAWTRWVSYPENKTITYLWRSPTWRTRKSNFRLRAEWSKTWVPHHALLPMEEGEWTLSLWDGGDLLMEETFIVSKDAPLMTPLEKTLPSLRSIDVKLTPAAVEAGPDGDVELTVSTHWRRRTCNFLLDCRWRSPSGKMTDQQIALSRIQTMLDCSIQSPPEEGEWAFTIATGDGINLARTSFRVAGREIITQSTSKHLANADHEEAADGTLADDEMMISFVHFNDLHANYHPKDYDGRALSPLSLIKGYYSEVKAENTHTLFCSAGDEMEKGSLVDLISNGESTIEIYKALGLDLRTIGNHDFAYSVDQVKRFAEYPGDVALCANQGLGKEFHSFEAGGVRIGVFGLVGRPWDERDAQYSGPYYPGIECRYDFNEVAREIVSKYRDDVDVLFLLSHLGFRDDREVADEVEGIDFIIGGHSHTLLRRAYISRLGTPVVQVGAYGEYVGRFDVIVDRNTRKMNRYRYQVRKVHPKNMQPDLELERTIRDILDRFGPEATVPVCRSSRRLEPSDVARITAKAAVTLLDVEFAVIDVKTIWKPVSEGELSRQDLLDIYEVEIQPSGTHGFNSMAIADISGADMTILRDQSGERFEFLGPDAIQPDVIYRVAIQRRTALRIHDYFPAIKTSLTPRFQMETWELLARYGIRRHEQGQAIDE